MQKDSAVGIIPIYKDGKKILFCLIQDVKGYWGFPKGHQDEGESEESTALRELEEETGIREVELDRSQVFSETYMLPREDEQVEKTVKYFLGYVQQTDNQTPDTFKKEIPQMKWFPYNEALAAIRPQTRPLLEAVKRSLLKIE